MTYMQNNNNYPESTSSVKSDTRFKSFRLTLTPSEKEILDLIAQGYLNKQIAFHLHVKEQTIKNSTTNIFKKLGVCNRTEAAVKAIVFRNYFSNLPELQ